MNIEEPQGEAFNRALGDRLRLARRARGWSLMDIEAFTGGEFKASVVGAYERGERALTAYRLVRLASIYEVSLATLLIDAPRSPSDATIDLTVADRLPSDNGEFIDRFLAAIQVMRTSGANLTVRGSDLKVLSLLLADTRSSSVRNEVDER